MHIYNDKLEETRNSTWPHMACGAAHGRLHPGRRLRADCRPPRRTSRSCAPPTAVVAVCDGPASHAATGARRQAGDRLGDRAPQVERDGMLVRDHDRCGFRQFELGATGHRRDSGSSRRPTSSRCRRGLPAIHRRRQARLRTLGRDRQWWPCRPRYRYFQARCRLSADELRLIAARCDPRRQAMFVSGGDHGVGVWYVTTPRRARWCIRDRARAKTRTHLDDAGRCARCGWSTASPRTRSSSMRRPSRHRRDPGCRKDPRLVAMSPIPNALTRRAGRTRLSRTSPRVRPRAFSVVSIPDGARWCATSSRRPATTRATSRDRRQTGEVMVEGFTPVAL